MPKKRRTSSHSNFEFRFMFSAIGIFTTEGGVQNK